MLLDRLQRYHALASPGVPEVPPVAAPLSRRVCPVPKCGKKLRSETFFCKTHTRMIPPVIAAAIKKVHPEYMALARTDPARPILGATLKQALAFAFASVCDQLGLELPGTPKKPEPPSVAAGIRKALKLH
jgi:hypothetical protein